MEIRPEIAHEKSALNEIREALYEIRRSQGTSAPICSARVRNTNELKESLQRSNWPFTPFAPNPSNRFEPRPQGLSEANRDAARQTSYVGQVLGMPILVDGKMAPGMLCVYDYAGSLVREIIIDQTSYDTWAKKHGYWRKTVDLLGDSDSADAGTSDDFRLPMPPANTARHKEPDGDGDTPVLPGTPVYGLWCRGRWGRWPSGELITSGHLRVLRATLREICNSRRGNNNDDSSDTDDLELAVIREIQEDGTAGRIF